MFFESSLFFANIYFPSCSSMLFFVVRSACFFPSFLSFRAVGNTQHEIRNMRHSLTFRDVQCSCFSHFLSDILSSTQHETLVEVPRCAVLVFLAFSACHFEELMYFGIITSSSSTFSERQHHLYGALIQINSDIFLTINIISSFIF